MMHLAMHLRIRIYMRIFLFRPWYHMLTSSTTRLRDKVGILHLAVNMLAFSDLYFSRKVKWAHITEPPKL